MVSPPRRPTPLTELPRLARFASRSMSESVSGPRRRTRSVSPSSNLTSIVSPSHTSMTVTVRSSVPNSQIDRPFDDGDELLEHGSSSPDCVMNVRTNCFDPVNDY